jgi:hypothetical protein
LWADRRQLGGYQAAAVRKLAEGRMAPWARFELATLRLTAETVKNLSALSGVAYTEIGAILPALVAPNPAPKLATEAIIAISVGRLDGQRTAGPEHVSCEELMMQVNAMHEQAHHCQRDNTEDEVRPGE